MEKSKLEYAVNRRKTPGALAAASPKGLPYDVIPHGLGDSLFRFDCWGDVSTDEVSTGSPGAVGRSSRRSSA
jgi:hypothetical protein